MEEKKKFVVTHKYGWRLKEIIPIIVFVLLSGGVWFSGNLVGSILVSATFGGLAVFMFLVNINRKSKSLMTATVDGNLLVVDGMKWDGRRNRINIKNLSHVSAERDSFHPTFRLVGKKNGVCSVPERLASVEPLRGWLQDNIRENIRVHPTAEDPFRRVFGRNKINVGVHQIAGGSPASSAATQAKAEVRKKLVDSEDKSLADKFAATLDDGYKTTKKKQ